MVYKGHLKFQISVTLRIPTYGSRNLAYIAYKMDYMCPLQTILGVFEFALLGECAKFVCLEGV